MSAKLSSTWDAGMLCGVAGCLNSEIELPSTKYSQRCELSRRLFLTSGWGIVINENNTGGPAGGHPRGEGNDAYEIACTPSRVRGRGNPAPDVPINNEYTGGLAMSQEQSIDYRAVLADLEARRAQLDQAIAAIRLFLGEQGDGGSALFTEVKSDTFFGLSVTDAAKKYLTIVKDPKSTQEIADALKAGGFKSTAKNFYSNVFTALSRDDTFCKIKRGQWALSEWSPGLSRSKTTKENGKPMGREDGSKDTEGQEPKG